MPEKQIIPASMMLPNKLFIIPLSGNPIYPGIFTPMMLSEAQDIALADESMSGDSMLGFLLLRSNESQNTDADELYTIGTAAKIIKRINLPDGGI
ncbi:MAG: endopeptidase La, partial [Spirochaetales bacterium]